MAISIADSSCSSPRSSLGFLLDPEKIEPPRPKQSMWHRLGLRRWLGRDDRDFSSQSRSPASASSDTSPASNDRSKRSDSPPPKSHDNLTRRLSRRVGVGLPRSAPFKRQHSERRTHLSPVDTEPRRAVSADRRTLSLQRTKSPQSVVDPRLSAPEVHWREDPNPDHQTKVDEPPAPNEEVNQDSDVRSEWDAYPEVTDAPEEYPVNFLDMELEKRWILNLSMHFRDRSEREKFFVTYAAAPNRWRRVTISCDYRDAEPESLEQDLKELRYQRDKSARVYDSIRESLPDIQFYDTVTNLKLETRDGRLHVHVTEDVNEIIPYPPISSIGHIPEARLVRERQLHFEAHLSGFVYNVKLDGRYFIKKEIPGPDTVDEFLYEINALHALQGTPNVIQVEGVVVDDQEEIVKGLLISFAEKGALVDILYEYRGTITWERRERWARQIVHGLCEIHEAGYVQGDFTLSNIVVDANDDAKIIDINRRGCPVGWEPPEIADKIESNQRISMYIGVKTDLYQLGMTLWALAMEEDEPERQRRPFMLDEDIPVPDYYRRMVSICLSPIPRQRLSAKELLGFFPRGAGAFDQTFRMQPHASMGVGLHNGALPLYDPRAAFMYPRGRQMGSSGHNDMQIPQQPPIDSSFGSASSPGYDRHTIYREEQERQLDLDEMDQPPPTPPQSNGIRKGNSMIFDERRSMNGSTTKMVEIPRHSADTREYQDNTLEYEESEIKIDAGVDPLYRESSTSLLFVPPPNAVPLPNELAGVGGHPAFSLTPSSSSPFPHQTPELTAATEAPAEIYPVDSGAELYTTQGPSQSVSSLRQSTLPINPASEPLDQGIPATKELPPASVTLDYPERSIDPTSYYLSDSNLPINPAVQPLEQEIPETEDHLPPASVTLAYPELRIDPTSYYLSDSVLPIDSAVQPLDQGIPETEEYLPPSTIASELVQQNFSPTSYYLSDSTLPINPAVNDLRVDPLPPLDVQSALDFFHESLHDTSPYLIESLLPINPAAKASESSYLETDNLETLIAETRSECPQEIQENSDLNDSLLPINPATKSVEPTVEPELETPSLQSMQSIQYTTFKPPSSVTTPAVNEPSPECDASAPSEQMDAAKGLEAQPETTPSVPESPSVQVTIQSHESPALSNSQLPINPAMTTSEGLSEKVNLEMDTEPAFQPSPKSRHCQPSIQFQTQDPAPLSDSQLPINLATSPEEPCTSSDTQPTLHPQHNIQYADPGSLKTSDLPINPAYTDKSLQHV
ncbi:hypothetical protein BJX99DRAFT_231689 [Aspergillus californicus]